MRPMQTGPARRPRRRLPPLSAALLERLCVAAGPGGWIAEPSAMAPYLAEQRGLYESRADLVLRPDSTARVAAVMTIAADAGIAVVPQGGNTGLVGATVADGGIILSSDRMTRIRALDPVDMTMTVDAGCILADLQSAAEEAGVFFPLSLGAEGSCRIGGNLSTNAGGVGVLRYGNARDLVLGLEVVLPDGRVWNGLRALRKDNTGYALKHLFVGAEGTLGVITGAALKLFPLARARETAMVGAKTADDLLALLAGAQSHMGDLLSAFEFSYRFGLETACRHGPGIKDPFAAPHACYALLEVTSPRPGDPLRDGLERVLFQALDAGHIDDAVIAESGRHRDDFWAMRAAIAETQAFEGASIKHDIAVPVSAVPRFLKRADAAVLAAMPDIRICAFGHMGDGNVHYNLSQPAAMDAAAFLDQWDRFNRIVHDIVAGLDGSFSAEHGIGLIKTEELRHYRSEVELELMGRIKRAFDPDGRMNPGKVFGDD